MSLEYTTITIDLTGQGGTGTDGTLYAELFTTVTLANNDTVPPRRYTATVTSGAGSIVLPCTATALKGTNAPFRVSFTPTSGAEVVLGRIIPTESATAVQLSDLLEVGGTSASPVTTYNVDATTLTISPSIAQLQAMRGLSDGLRVLVQDVGVYRYAAASTATADEAAIVTPATATGRWLLEIPAADSTTNAIDIRLYGAATTAADNTPALLAAATAASTTGGRVFIPAGNWACTTALAVTASIASNIEFVGEGPASHLDFSGAGAITTCIKMSGTLAETSVAFSAGITKGDTAITFPSAPTGVVAGSLLLIYDSANGGFNAARDEYRKGEWVKVKSVSSGTVTLDGPVFDTYATGGTRKIYLVTPITAGFRNLRATFKAGLTGIEFELGHKCVAADLYLSGSDTSHVTFDRCYESTARAVQAYDVQGTTGTNYGISVGNSQRILIEGCHLDTTRHGLAIGGGDVTGCVPNRDVLATGNIINGHFDSLPGADIHGNCEFVTYRNNRLLAGISFGGDCITIAENDIRTNSGTEKNGISASELLGPNNDIHGNTITATGALTSGNSAAINFSKNSSSWQYATRAGTLRITKNVINMASYNGAGIYVRNGQANDMLASTAAIDLDVSGNSVSGTTASTDRYGVEIVGQPTGTANKGFRTVRATHNALNNATLYVNAPGARTTVIAENDVLNAAVQGIVYGAAANYHGTYQTEEEAVLIENNRVVRPNSTGIQAVGASTGARTYVTAKGNTSLSACQGGTTGSNYTDSSCYVATASIALLEGNTWGKLPNDATGAQARLYGVNGITTLYERDNTNAGSVTTVEEASITTRRGGYWSSFGTFLAGLGSPGSGTASERFGTSASVGSANNATAFGNLATSTGASSLAVGYNAQATQTASTAVGASAAADSNTNATAIGYAASSDGVESVAVGSTATANSAYSTVVGSGAVAGSGALNTILGRSASATTGANNTIIGAGAAASTHAKAIVLGINAAASGDNQVQLGASGDECNTYAWGDVRLGTVGKGLKVAEGSNATMGLATLVGGTVTVSTTKVTANSRIFLTGQADGGTPGWQRVSARTAATSFTITSSSGTDTSTVAWLIVEPI